MYKYMKMKLFVVLFLIVEVFLALTCVSAEAGSEVGFDDRALQFLYDFRFQSVENGIIAEIPTKAGRENINTIQTFKLPASLQIIEDEAFEGTAIVGVDLPETVESIGNRAFANIFSLQFVKIPCITTVIAKNAFLGSNHVKITGAPNSYARIWAKENGVPFTACTVLYACTSNVQASSGIYTRQTKPDIETIIDTDENVISPQSRPVEDIKADRFDQYIANSLCTRAPPACA